ncbi:MAG: phosphate-starvation-inducible PsiE family protein [Synechococcaceae cyanobacterium SM2_3_2]|nr:phosphate-starvation-inducible PsiE family protein [Synechococcaceae cyanobacterium SM2_3_2]
MRWFRWLFNNPHQDPNQEPFMRWVSSLESLIARLLTMLLVGVTIFAVFDLGRYLLTDLFLDPVGSFSTSLIEIFGLFLNILIALEILENITAYFQKQVVQVELVIITSLTAVARKIIIFDFEKLNGIDLLGLGAATLALSISYWLVRRTNDNR